MATTFLYVVSLLSATQCLLYLALLSTISVNAKQAPLPHELTTWYQEAIDEDAAPVCVSWDIDQRKIAYESILDNIAPGGKHAVDAVPGTVLASPSRNHPDYYYQWTRDSAITLKTLVDNYQDHSVMEQRHVRTVMRAYVELTSQLQRTPNPSGNFADLQGLGEPKFNTDGSAFTGPWGRPQHDGPALRAITLIVWLRTFNVSMPELWEDERSRDCVYKQLYSPSMPAESVIKGDLEYVARYWNTSGFDVWEEAQGIHFFTAMVQLRALREGAEIADAFGDDGAARWYREQALGINSVLDQFWDNGKGHLVATLDSHRSGLDCSVLLGALHGSTMLSSEHFDNVLAPYSDEILVSMLRLIRDQRKRFPINEAQSREKPDFCGKDIFGAGIGRYPEDVYDGDDNSERGGNPWFICTATVSEILFRTSQHVVAQNAINVTARGVEFWRSVLPGENLKAGDILDQDDMAFWTVAQCLRMAGRSFLHIIRDYTAANGSMSEQFDRETGHQRGARDLTWSYGSFLQAIQASDASFAAISGEVYSENWFNDLVS